jgi:hypothetical protein
MVLLVDYIIQTDDPSMEYIKSVAPIKLMVPLKNFHVAKSWITECEIANEECPKQKMVKLPTRLVEVSPLMQPKAARLRTTAGQKGLYIALSYCWGGPQPFKTTIANFHAYTESLPYDSLPKTILDAFEVSRNLEIQFIWIDSLCII